MQGGKMVNIFKVNLIRYLRILYYQGQIKNKSLCTHHRRELRILDREQGHGGGGYFFMNFIAMRAFYLPLQFFLNLPTV